MSGLREQQKQDRESRLLHAAAPCFRSAGYGNATIEDIARQAGLSPGTVYNYYGHKGEMLIALVAMILLRVPVAVAIGLVGCHEGLGVSGSAESVGKQTTKSVVVAIFLVIIIDAAFTILFSYIGV
mgnify:CR=1 FL=1